MTHRPFLEASALTAALGDHAGEVSLHLLDTVDSTNTEAKRRVTEGSASSALYIARTQTGGRGRLGRTFHSPATGLYMTLALATDRPLSAAVTVTAHAAVAAATAIEALTGRAVGIKWVNDLYLDGGKLAGILTEAVTAPDGHTHLLVGIGINLTTASFPADLRAPAASLFSPAEATHDTPALRGALAGEITRRLLGLIAADEPARRSALAAYRSRLLYIGEPVICTRGSEAFTGALRGVDEGYSLLVETDGEMVTLCSGEISVRPQA